MAKIRKSCPLHNLLSRLTPNFRLLMEAEKLLLKRYVVPPDQWVVVARSFFVVVRGPVVDDNGNDSVVLQYLKSRIIDITFEPVLNIFWVNSEDSLMSPVSSEF
ncbi:hypothetical protein AVEN_71720-1 [Araneus ventricosus]|uniref:Uncharacterized protein n=1 Tax=Araneus ventricosus TaxID=182803 RepID=A0A4Y2VUZ1_ARAVE|nr:hypothetical protein AVEN_71720-1 [Araneus ventricosus]